MEAIALKCLESDDQARARTVMTVRSLFLTVFFALLKPSSAWRATTRPAHVPS